MRTATTQWGQVGTPQKFQSSRSLRTATIKELPVWQKLYISILAVLADRDKSSCLFKSKSFVFQSSRSLRTATCPVSALYSARRYFNPRGPCGPRLDTIHKIRKLGWHFNPRGPCGPRRKISITRACNVKISILAVLADRDGGCYMSTQTTHLFQSSRSLRTATAQMASQFFTGLDFNPRGPCGPRLRKFCSSSCTIKFQSSRSLRTATYLRQGGFPQNQDFNPRGPCGPRLV